MIYLPDSHTDELVLGVGAHRACYIHPKDPQKCIKVIYSQNDPIALKEIKRELAYYKHLNTYLTDWRGLTRYYGTVETNLGTGYVYDRIVDFDGGGSQTLKERYSQESLQNNWRELDDLVEKLKKYLWDNLIVTMALKPHNILCHRISETEIFPVICDNIGFAQRIPLVLYWPWFCHQKQKRLFKRFEKQPLIKTLRECEKIFNS